MPWRVVYIRREWWLDAATRIHEAEHTRQADANGWRFWPRILGQYLVYGYDLAPYELEARIAERKLNTMTLTPFPTTFQRFVKTRRQCDDLGLELKDYGLVGISGFIYYGASFIMVSTNPPMFHTPIDGQFIQSRQLDIVEKHLYEAVKVYRRPN